MTEIIDEENLDTVEENYTEKINNNKDASFAALFNNPELSDIVLSVNTIYTYHAHKLVLASRSEVFKAMLSTKWNEKELKTLELHESPEAQDNFHDFLYYIYSGVVNLHLANVAGLYTLADKYNTQCLRSSTMQYMSEHIATNSRNNQALNWLVWAQNCRHTDFERKCYNFIINNFSVVVNSGHWTDIDLNNLITILKSSDLVVQDEREVFEAIEKWLMGKEKEIVPLLLKSLIPYLRLSQIWPIQLSHLEQHSDIIKRYKKFLIPELLDAYRYQTLPLESRVMFVTPSASNTPNGSSPLTNVNSSTVTTNTIHRNTVQSVTNELDEIVNLTQNELSLEVIDDTASVTSNIVEDNSEHSSITTISEISASHEAANSVSPAIGRQIGNGVPGLPSFTMNFNEPKYKMRTYLNKNYSFSLELKHEGDHYGPLTFTTSKSSSFLDQSAWQWNLKLYYNSTNNNSNKLKISISDVYNKQGYLWNGNIPANSYAGVGTNNHHHHHHPHHSHHNGVAKRNLQIAFLIGHKKRDGYYYKQYKYVHDFTESESFELADFYKDWNLSSCNNKIKLVIVMKPMTEI